MSKRHKSRIEQWLVRAGVILLLILCCSILESLFGKDSIVVSFYKDNFLYTPYNITGMIMLPFALGGVWLGRKNGRKLFLIISIISSLPSFLSFISFFNLEGTVDEPERKITWVTVLVFVLWGILLFLLINWFVNLIKSKMYGQSSNTAIKENGNDNPVATPSVSDTESPKDNFENTAPIIPFFKINNPSTENIKHRRKPRKRKASANNNKNKNSDKLIPATDEQTISYNREDAVDFIYGYEFYQVAHKICPRCGGELKSRKNRETRKWFIGCQNYFSSIKCTFTMDYKEFKDIEREIKQQKDLCLTKKNDK